MSEKLLIKKLNIDHFRGLNSLKIEDLSNVNIFVGANNSGKTSVLEALRILGWPYDFTRIVELTMSRARSGTAAKPKTP